MNSQSSSSSYSADPGLSGRPAAIQFNAVHSPAEYVKELACYNEAKDRASFNAAIEALQKRSHQGGNNGNYDSNPDDPVASAQHREHVRSSPSSQLPSLTSANPNGPASQNSVLKTPQNLVEFNNECLLAYTKYLIPNSEFARVHQRMNQEQWQQQQLAREEAAKLKESVVTALAKAIAASSRPDLDQADPLPIPTTGGSPGGGSTAPISTKPGSAAASQPLNQTLANPKGLANQNMVPQTNPNSVPQTSNTLAHQANPIKQLPNNDFLKVIQAEPLPVAGTLMCQISTGLDVWQVVRRFLYLRSGRLR
jgi:hypothetical protein